MPKYLPIISTDKWTVKPKELVKLWAIVGWCKETDYAHQTVKAGIRNTSLLVSARNKNGQLIGFARVLSDEHTIAWLAELVVHPDYQSKGVGKRLVRVVKDYYNHTSLVLETFTWNRKFFNRCGFRERKLIVFVNN